MEIKCIRNSSSSFVFSSCSCSTCSTSLSSCFLIEELSWVANPIFLIVYVLILFASFSFSFFFVLRGSLWLSARLASGWRRLVLPRSLGIVGPLVRLEGSENILCLHRIKMGTFWSCFHELGFHVSWKVQVGPWVIWLFHINHSPLFCSGSDIWRGVE